MLASVLWPAALAGGMAARLHDHESLVAGVVYYAGSLVCHQRPERSFHAGDVRWPVCGRCAGLYLAAPAGALAALLTAASFRRRREVSWLAIAAIPTAVTFLLEHTGLTPMTSLIRFLAALPLGAMVAWVVVTVAAEPARAIE